MKRKTLTLALVLLSASAFATDHMDSPAAVNDPVADILDFYAFMNPPCTVVGGMGCQDEPEELILALTAYPFATAETQFSDEVSYHFYFENDVGVTNQIDCSFSKDQVVTCAGLNGLSVTAPVGEIGVNGDIRVFAGLRDDPTFWDAEALELFETIGILAFTDPGTDSFAGANVLSIVLGIQNDAFPAGSGATDTNGASINVQKIWVSSERTTQQLKGLSSEGGGLTGSWYNPAQNGQGFNIEVIGPPEGAKGGNIFLAYFYGYEDDGDHLWLVGTAGDFDGSSATIDVLRFSGMGFGDGFVPPVTNEVVGSMTFNFADCNNATVMFAPVAKGLTGFTTDIERITSIASLGCTDVDDKELLAASEPATTLDLSSSKGANGSSGGLTGSWYNPAQNGQGYNIEVIGPAEGAKGGNVFLGYFYGYEDDGDQLWLVGTAGDFDGSSATIDVLRFSGMGFGDGFDPGSVSNEVVGSMTFSFADCNNGSVTFAPVAKGLTGFTTDIERITSIASLGCGSKAQIDRMGRPLVSRLIPDPMKDAYNAASDPSTWSAMFRDEIVTSITATDTADGVPGNVFLGIEALATILVDDRLQVDLEWSACSSYFGIESSDAVPQPHTNDCGGRKLTEDVFDLTISIWVASFDPFVQDFVNANDVPFLEVFPFLAPPN